jgi:hypothetical protein
MKIIITHNQSTIDPSGTIPDKAFPAVRNALEYQYRLDILETFPEATVDFLTGDDPISIRVSDDPDGTLAEDVQRLTALAYSCHGMDFDEVGVLSIECVRVLFLPEEHPLDPEITGVFGVVIHPGDRDYTHQSSVCRALADRGFEILSEGHGSNGISVIKPSFVPSADFTLIQSL